MARLILLCLALLPVHAWAAPVVAAVAAAWAAVGTYVMVAMTVYSLYSSVSTRRKARAAAAKARADYLASLTDRRITVLSEESPRQVIYGEPAPLGGRIVAVLSSGNIDQFRHVVVMFAAHECEKFVDVLIDNDSAFPLDANGWSTSSKFNDADDDGTANADDEDSPAGSAPRLNIQLHTSAGGVDTADAFLMAACPQKWTAAHKATGYTYAVITFDLRLSRFQGGIPNITARLRGKKVHDPRTGLTSYSRNAALCTADFIQSREGYGAKLSQFDLNDLIAAANACERGYNCDGAFSTDQDRDTTRQQQEDAMAGATLESGGVWRVLAGAWSSPLIALDDDDQLARPEVLQTCYPGTERHNGAKGSYIKAGGDGSAIDFPPYQNAVFREADGKDKYMDLTLPFVSHVTQCRQLAMIRTEQSRGGLILKITPKMLAWHLQPGDRLTLTSKFLGFTNKPFRVQDWSYSVASPLALQVIEDEESFYDEVEEQSEDPAPNADLPNPFIAASPPSSLAAASGPDWMVQQGDTLVARVRLSWDASGRQDVLSTGRTQVQWRITASGSEWQAIEAPGNATSTILLGLQTGATYDIRVRFVTALSIGTWANVSHTVLGLVDDPAAVAGLMLSVAEGGIHAAWQAPRELDLLSWAYTELRLGTTWTDGSVVYSGKATTSTLPWMPAGNNLVWAAHANTVGGWSEPTVAALNVLSPGQPVLSAEVQGKAIHLSWPDVRTTQPLDRYRIYVGASLATAALLGYAAGTSFDYQESTAGARTYWVVPYDKGGNAGPAGYIAVQSMPSIDEAVAELESGLDEVVEVLTGGDPLPAPGTLIRPLIPLTSTLSQLLTGSPTQDPADLLSQLPVALIPMAQQQDAINRETLQALSDASEALLRTALDARSTAKLVRDAGIYADPATGTVHIYAVDANAERTNALEILMDSMRGQLALRATTAYVNSAIAQASLSEADLVLFEGMDARVSQVELQLDSVEGALALKASALSVSNMGAQVTQVEQRLDLAEQSLQSKVSQAEFEQTAEGLTGRLGTAEQTLAAIGDVASITATVAQTRKTADDLEEDAETTLRDLLSGWQARRAQAEASALATQEMRAYVDDGFTAEALLRTQLEARTRAVNADQLARLTRETTLRTEADQALGEQLDQLAVQTTTDKQELAAAIEEVANVSTSATASLAQTVSLVSAQSAQLSDEGAQTQLQDLLTAWEARRAQAVAAAQAREDTRAYVDGNMAAEVQARQLLTAKLATDIGELTAQASREATASVDRDRALAEQIDVVVASVDENAAAFSGQVRALADDQSAQAQQIQTIQAETQELTASVTQQSEALVDLDGKVRATAHLSVTAGGRIAGWVVDNDGTVRKMVMLTDTFAVAVGDQDVPVYAFVVGMVNGVPRVVVSADMFVDGGILARHVGARQITADKMQVTALSAVSANMGDVTAGVVRSPDYATYFNLGAQGNDIAFQVAGGKFYVRGNGYAEADRVNIRRREVMATGSVYWGKEWTKSDETATWNYDLETGWLVIDTGLDVADGVDFSINQPFHAIVSCTSANVGFRNLGGERAFELLTSAQTALSASHYANSGSTPGQAPRIKLMVRVPIVNVHQSVYRIRLDTFNWSLFRV